MLNGYKNKLSSNFMQNQLDLNAEYLLVPIKMVLIRIYRILMEFCRMYALHFWKLIIGTLVINMMKRGKILGLTKNVKKNKRSAQSKNRYNSWIVLRKVGILTLLRNVGILTIRSTQYKSLRNSRIVPLPFRNCASKWEFPLCAGQFYNCTNSYFA